MKKKLLLGLIIASVYWFSAWTLASDAEKKRLDPETVAELHKAMNSAFTEHGNRDEVKQKATGLEENEDEYEYEYLEARDRELRQHLKKVMELDESREAQAHCQGECQSAELDEDITATQVTVGAVKVELDDQVTLAESEQLIGAIKKQLLKHWRGMHHDYISDATKAGYYLKVVKNFDDVDDYVDDRSVEISLDLNADISALLGLLRMNARVAMAEIEALPDAERTYVQDGFKQGLAHILPFFGVAFSGDLRIDDESAREIFISVISIMQLKELAQALSADDEQSGEKSLFQEVSAAFHKADLPDEERVIKSFRDVFVYSPCSLASLYSLRRDTLLPYFGKPLTGWCDSLVGIRWH
ncbi:MAG: hypothetical protein ACR2PX_10990 [Endozoicomonas sp.]|uniref:hypothetical protein n=1 Tax=Endozoicomonas sp. TaxID=1892382 RepID=UPI003D9BE8B5